MLFGLLAEWLPRLRCINAGEADSVQLIGGVQHSESVAIGNADYPSMEGVG